MWFQNIFKDKPKQANPDLNGVVPNGEGVGIISPAALRQMNRLQLGASRYLHGSMIGNRPSTRRRPSADFQEHRAYAPGDDIRFVDWKASARQEHIYIRQGMQPKEVTVYLLLDCSASMAWGTPPKSQALRAIAAALAYLTLSGGDRLVISTITGQGTRFIGPLTGKGQFPWFLKQMQALQYGGSYPLRQAASELTQKMYSKGGLVFLLSDLLDTGEISGCFSLFPSPTWDVNVVQLLHRQELEPHLSGDYEMEDIETGDRHNYDITQETLTVYQQRLTEWRRTIELSCVENNIFYTLIPTDWELDNDILPHLRKMNILRPA
jgi:uncharacterized protein (DUF58 family)